jgi:hypothetical protein
LRVQLIYAIKPPIGAIIKYRATIVAHMAGLTLYAQQT